MGSPARVQAASPVHDRGGSADRDPEAAPTNHSAVAVFDDAALAEGTALYAELALRRLGC